MERHQCLRPQTARRCSPSRSSPTDTTLRTFGMQRRQTRHVGSHSPRRSRSGRWRSEYKVDLESRSVQGKIAVNVHYYEQGNVSHIPTFDLPSLLMQRIHSRSSWRRTTRWHCRSRLLFFSRHPRRLRLKYSRSSKVKRANIRLPLLKPIKT